MWLDAAVWLDAVPCPRWAQQWETLLQSLPGFANTIKAKLGHPFNGRCLCVEEVRDVCTQSRAAAEVLEFSSSYSSPGERLILSDGCIWQREFPGETSWQTAPFSTTVELPCGKGKYRHFKSVFQGRERGGKLCAQWRAADEEQSFEGRKPKAIFATSADPPSSGW